MKTTASDILIDAIHDWGVDVVFGLPGDPINGVMSIRQAEKFAESLLRGEPNRTKIVATIPEVRELV